MLCQGSRSSYFLNVPCVWKQGSKLRGVRISNGRGSSQSSSSSRGSGSGSTLLLRAVVVVVVVAVALAQNPEMRVRDHANEH